MPIVLQTPYVPSVPTYDKVHLDHLTITLERTVYAKAQIQARIRMYYQDPVTLEKHFSPDSKDIVIGDAEQFAVSLFQNGDTRGIEAMEHVKAIVAFLVETQTEFGATTIV